MGKKRSEPPPPAQAPFNDAFAALRGRLPAGSAPPPAPAPGSAPAPPPAAAAPAARGPARAVVRIERKGRGGKEATVVEKLGLGAADLERWTADARRALGCGGAVEDGALVLQGDQRERVARWLEARGVGKVTVAG
jgi:translation initiation factor 1